MTPDEAAELAGINRCSGESCGARIRWGRTRTGSSQPLDADANPSGNVVFTGDVDGHGTPVLETLGPLDAGDTRERYIAPPRDVSRRRPLQALVSRLEVGDPCPGSSQPAAPGHVDDALGFVCRVCGRPEAGKTARKHKLEEDRLEALRRLALERARPLRSARRHLDLAIEYLKADPLEGDGNLGLAAFKLRGQGSYIDRALEALEPFLPEGDV